tara:strand:+ start:775 stop:1506 length:732 start_codon:yes stop_codon:yes gene_type:complete
MTIQNWSAFVLSLTPVLLILLYIQQRIRKRSGDLRTIETRSVLFGGLAALGAEISFGVLTNAASMTELNRLDQMPTGTTMVYIFGIVAPIEEVCKLLAAVAAGVVWSRPQGKGTVATIWATGFVGLGFAMYENYSLGVRFGVLTGPELLTRPIVHLLLGFVMGIGLAHASYLRPMRRFGNIILTLVLVSTLHGLYNWVVYDPNLPGLLVPLVLCICILITWLGLRFYEQFMQQIRNRMGKASS